MRSVTLSYADNVVQEFTTEARNQGIDIFRVFDSVELCEQLEIRHRLRAKR